MSGSPPLEGGCLCGRVRYRLLAPPGPVVLCHCNQCRKAQGSAFAANAPLRRADFQLLSGAEALCGFESSPGKWRNFCRHCGSPLHSHRDSAPEVLRLRIGSLDEGAASRAALRPLAHIHVASKAPWWEIEDTLPQHAGIEPGRR